MVRRRPSEIYVFWARFFLRSASLDFTTRSRSELPFERPTKFDLGISLRIAKAPGLALPPTVLVQVRHPTEGAFGGTSDERK